MDRKTFQKKIGYTFKDETLLTKALTHSSYVKDRNLSRTECNERLEYLGDAFLDAIIGEELFRRLETEEEGQLSKLRASVVCEKALYAIGTELQLGDMLYLGNGEERSGGRTRASVIADVVEAVIGAIFLDSDYNTTHDLVLRIFEKTIGDALSGRLNSDYKSAIQEIAQASGQTDLQYKLDREEGPPHDRTFYMSLYIGGKRVGTGSGKTKKEAEQAAAKMAYQKEK